MGWAYGLANLDDGIPITPKTSFHLASLSKQFTASAIALLILNHKIALSDSVAIYIPEVAKYGQGPVRDVGMLCAGRLSHDRR
jgi:CubicO group peptidase (beta-lactamase class C family)